MATQQQLDEAPNRMTGQFPGRPSPQVTWHGPGKPNEPPGQAKSPFINVAAALRRTTRLR